jgi:hypothetical protein
MAERIDQAELPERCVTHGLRNAAARRLAEAGCSANEIASITGHVSLEEVARYTKAAEQKKLARAAMSRLPGGKMDTGFPNLSERFGKNAEKDNAIKEGFGSLAPRRGPYECNYFSVLAESGDAESFRTIQGLSKSDIPTFWRP